MKRLALIVGLTLALAGTAHAWVTQVQPNGIGGYNVYGPPGSGVTQMQPNGIGGYNVYRPFGGGVTQIQPNGIGGYNIYPGFTPPPVFRPTVPNYGYGNGEE
jgi:opacity protein-like surface antigen